MDQEGEELRTLLRPFRERWHLWAGFVVAGVVAALALVLVLPVEYTASTRLVVRPLPGESDAATQSVGSIETQKQVLASRTVAERVAKRADVGGNARSLLKHISVEALGGAVMKVVATDGSAVRAARIADAFAEEYLAQRAAAASQRAGVQAEQLEAEAGELRAHADDLERRIADLQSRAGSNDEIFRLTTERDETLSRLGVVYATTLAAKQTSVADVGEVIDAARIPPSPSQPAPVRTMALGALLGLFAGVAVTFLRIHTDWRIRTRDDAARAAEVPALGAIVSARSRGLVATLDAEASTQADGYRALRLNLARRGLGRDWAVLLLVGVDDDRTGPLVAANLAVASTGAGNSSALISWSADDRAAERLRDAIDTGEPPVPAGLQVVTLPPADGRPAADHLAMAAPGVMATLRDAVDVVLCAAPMGERRTEALVLGGLVDAAVLVAVAGRTSRDATAQAAAELRQAGTNLIGVVVLDAARWDRTSGGASELRAGDATTAPYEFTDRRVAAPGAVLETGRDPAPLRVAGES